MSQDSSTTSDDGQYILYHFVPSRGAAILFTILILLSGLFYLCQLGLSARKGPHERREANACNYSTCGLENPGNAERVEYLQQQQTIDSTTDKKLKKSSIACCSIPFFIGTLLEAVGYIARAVSSSNKEALTPFIIQSVLLLIAPAFYAATIYMLFGRLLRAMQCEKLMLVSARFGTAFFVCGDVLSFILQAAGGGLMSQETQRVLGSHLAVAGLAVQIGFFGFFIINEFRFSVKVNRVCPFYWKISRKWFFFNLSLLVSSVLIMVRSIVRLIEFIQGSNGYIISHEVFIYIFDALPMFFVAVAFCVGFHFGDLFEIIDECKMFINPFLVQDSIPVQEKC